MRPVPPFTEAHEALRVEMRAFVEAELRPHAPEWEAARSLPSEVFTMLAGLGPIGGGTDEIMKEIPGKTLGL